MKRLTPFGRALRKGTQCVVFAISFWLNTAVLHAAGNLRVALVTSNANSPATRSIQAELGALGIDVIVFADRQTARARTELEAIARQVNAVAAVRVVDLGQTAEVWIADRATRKTVIREFVRTDARGASEDALAVGVVELLRASLMELHVPSAPGQSAAPAQEAELKRLAYPIPPKPFTPALLAMSIAPALEFGFDEIGPLIHGYVGLSFRPHQPLGARLSLLTTLAPAELRDARGRAEISSHIFNVQATHAFALHAGRIVPGVGAGITFVSLRALGISAGPNASTRDESVWVATPSVSASTSLRLLRNLALRAELNAIYAFEPIEIRFASTHMATWGRPGIFFGLGLEASFLEQP